MADLIGMQMAGSIGTAMGDSTALDDLDLDDLRLSGVEVRYLPPPKVVHTDHKLWRSNNRHWQGLPPR